MVAYLDSSLVLRHILLGEETIRHAMEWPRLVSSELLEIECRRTLHRCRMQGDLDDASLVEAGKRLDRILTMTDLVEIVPTIKTRAMNSFPVIVKTLDALHLATALALVERDEPASLQVFSHDKSMNLCALALGFGAPLFA